MFYKRIFFIIFLVFALDFVSAGQSSPDSLKAMINPDNKLADENKAEALSGLGKYYLQINPDSAAFFASSGLKLSMNIGYIPGVFSNSCILGKVRLRHDSITEAIIIFENARKLLEKLEDKRDALCVLLLLGYAHDVQREFYLAHDALYTGLEIAETTKDNEALWSYYNNLGVHHMEFGDHKNSLDFLHKGLAVFATLDESQKKFSLASTYVNLAVTFINLHQPDSAKKYLQLSLDVPDLKGNYYGIHNIYGNLGKVALMEGKPDSALAYFLTAASALDSLKINFSGTLAPLLANQYRSFGMAYYEKQEPEKAEKYFLDALAYSKIASDISVKADVLQRLSEIYTLNGDLNKALSYQKEYISTRDKLDARKTDEKITRLTLQLQFDKALQIKQQELELNEIRHRRKELIYLFAIVSTGGVLISLFLIYLLLRSKVRRKQLEEKAFRLEKEKISEELDYKNKELTTNVIYLLKKNEFISSISVKLNEVLGKLSEGDARILKSIIHELDKMSDEDTWKEFELRFKDVHTDFYRRLSEKFPELTAQELRLCAFLRLNMTNKEIAAITFQSTESLKTARYRLRKKIGIDRDENLVAYLTRL